MKLQRAGWAGLAFGGALVLFAAQPVRAQDHSAGTDDHAAASTYDSSNWQAPRGYDEAYPENGTPNMVARQGYAAGYNEGRADASRGKKFEPTDNKAYGKAAIPKGMDKDQFKQQFREAFVKGYSNGYKGIRGDQ